MIDSLSARILQHCRDDFKPIKLLIDKSTSRSSLYRRKNMLCEKGWLQTDSKDRYRTTEEGLQQLQSLFGEAPAGLADVYPPLAKVPTPYHTAAIELAIAAVIARKHKLRPDRHPSIVVAGPTLKWKTSAAIFLCHILGLDPSTNIVNLAAEYGKSLWLRKNSKGEVSYKRDLLQGPLVVFDEFQNADPECKRLLKIWMDGRIVLPLENEKLTLQATSFITLNPREGQTLEERVGLEIPQIRRCIICDLTHIEIPNLAIKGEEIVNAAKAHTPLVLPKPRHDCTSYKAQTYELLSHTLNETGRELVDLETLIMLSTAMTAFMEPIDAIRRVLYDSYLLYQTLGWTLPEWQLHITSFPQTVLKNIDAEISPPNHRTISQEILTKAFRHLNSGGSTTELITKLGLTYDDADKIARKHVELKSLDSKIRTKGMEGEKEDEVVQKLERAVRIAELEKKKAEFLKPIETDKMFTALNTTLDASGRWKQEHCTHLKNSYCMYWHWEQEPDFPYQIGEPLFKYRKWFIRPTYSRCAVCSAYFKKGSISIQTLDTNIKQTLDANLKQIQKIFEANITSDLKKRFKCSTCGCKGFVAVKIQCTKCGTETWWGWRPS